jgi:glucose-6-phosphate isomerase
VIVVSKTFTTAETMLNSRNMKQWVIEAYKKINPQLTANDIDNIISHHFCAVSSNIPKTEAFGIDKENVFGFWDWVGGRYSVWSAVGALPLSICFSYETFEEFLTGGKAIDDSIRRCDNDNVINNIPIMLGLIGFYNTFIRNINTRAVLPYSQALSKFPSHIQQLDMESNGKKVSKFTNEFLEYECGPVVFGEAGTNGQHSFYQLIHQGRELTCEFIAHCVPQFDCHYEGEKVSSHVELMSNFFAQPDALAYGKYTQDELKDVPQELLKHKTFKGDRTSLSMLFKELNAFTVGELLAIYEHRVACEGFIYGINSFDQWGVELGKKLANNVREVFAKKDFADLENKYKEQYNTATLGLMRFFIDNKKWD